MRIKELSPIGNICTNATTKKPKQRAIDYHIIINTGGTIWARMHDYRLSYNMFSNDKNTEILIHKKHIIRKVSQLFINVERLGEKIYTTLMMPLITEPLNNTFIHRFKVSIIPN